MDHGQLETGAREMSQGRVAPDELCDNSPAPETPAAQTRNLNEANALAQTLSPLQYEEGERCGLIQKSSLNNNGKEEEEEEEVKQLDKTDKGQSRDEDEEEDTDEVMKEEDESEESGSLIRCHSPDTPMTDSSYSETGSLLETSCACSPGTSPEPTSPVTPVVSPVEHSQRDAEAHTSSTRPGASPTEPGPCTRGPAVTTGPAESASQTGTLASCVPEATDRKAKTTDSTTTQLTSSAEPCSQGSASSYAGPVASAAEEPTSTTGAPPVTTGPASSNWENTCPSVSPCTTEPLSSPALLESLEQLTQRGDDSHLPQHLHQIAEAFVHHQDYQRALWCIQLEKLYHQRVLDNLKALQEQWESRCEKTSFGLETKQLDSLKHICQTHTRPRTEDAECTSWDLLRDTFEEGSAVPSCSSANQMEGVMKQRVEDASCPVTPSADFPENLNALETERNDPDGVDESPQANKQPTDQEGDEAEGGVGHTTAVVGNGLHPRTTGEMDQSVPAEQQGQDLDPAQEKEVKSEEERDVEEAEEALEMEDEGEEEGEEENQEDGECLVVQEALPVETLGSSTAVRVQPLHQDTLTQENLYKETQLCQETQESSKPGLVQEVHLPQEADMKQQEPEAEEKEDEEEYEDYEEDQARIIREAPTLDEMAKLITVEEVSPASGLTSILKKRSICTENLSISARSESRPEKPTAKRRVRFKVPDEGYEHDVGSGDSCLLLVLLCLVTVVISVGGTALYCALGNAQSSVCQDFSKNADFYFDQIQRGIAQVQHWFALGS
ncbi:consortin isoform X2 [Salarias fasciatus]|uniref:consortin isoform X2 n=1 Tax=Salarias fasciatus TaxID=181472 RepID=UPI0011764FBC|nr:consortin isoform X2 [Salarias fasciatus]